MDVSQLMQFLTQGGGAAAASAINPAAAILQGIPEAVKLGLSIKQGIDASRIRKNLVRPQMGVPGGVSEATDLLRMMAYDPRMPGQTTAENNLLRSQAQANQSIMNSGAGSPEKLAALAAGGIGGMDAMTNLAATAAQSQQGELNNLANQLNQVGNWQNQAWQWNEMQKFQERAAAAQQLGDASNRNAYSALKGLGGAAASAITTPTPETLPFRSTMGMESRTPGIPFGTSPDLTRDIGMVAENAIGSQRINPMAVQIPQQQYTPIRSLPAPDFSEGFLSQEELDRINQMFNYSRGF